MVQLWTLLHANISVCAHEWLHLLSAPSRVSLGALRLSQVLPLSQKPRFLQSFQHTREDDAKVRWGHRGDERQQDQIWEPDPRRRKPLFVWLRGHICTPNSAFVSEIPPHTFGLSEPQQACRVLNTLMFKNGRISFTVMVWKRTPQLVKWFSSDSALLCFGAGFRVECSC